MTFRPPRHCRKSCISRGPSPRYIAPHPDQRERARRTAAASTQRAKPPCNLPLKGTGTELCAHQPPTLHWINLNMNTSLTLVCTALLLANTASAFAASSVDLTVKGVITPNACTPTFSGGGVVDHGKIASKDLVQNNPTTLPKAMLKLSINCEGPTAIAIRPVDNRAGTATGSSDFGLGLINTNKKLGRFYLTPLNMVADAVPVQPIASGDGGRTWYAEWAWELQTLWGAGALDDATTLLPVKDLVMDLEVTTQIARADQFDFSEEQPIDGSGTLEVMYL